jgi:alginate O-acetyltransferase complex protein AlgI
VAPLKNPIDFTLYIALFPQLIAGPIVRFHEIRDQLVGRLESSELFAAGAFRFAHGLGKKVLIADTVAPIANAAFAAPAGELGAGGALIGALAYTVQIYFDFSGYSDMALGLGAMFGFRLPENFARPYSSRSITEFWRRWHMSLSRWFRDYLYVPLGGNRHGLRTTIRNLVIVFVITGFWHGANWTFLAWGAYHGSLLLLERLRGTRGDPTDPAPNWIGMVRTLGLVVIGWILFRSPDIGSALAYFGAFLDPSQAPPPSLLFALDPIATTCLLVGLATVLLPRDWVTGRLLWEAGRGPIRLYRPATLLLVFPVAVIFLVAGTFSPFLYFQF